MDFKHRYTTWLCWVPSPDNPADCPSRVVLNDLLRAAVPEARWQSALHACHWQLLKWGGAAAPLAL
eukprot:579781-Amphidinium_carterae.1